MATVGTYAYNVHTFFFSLDVPRWQALAWSAAQSAMYLVPAFAVPMRIRKDIISIYATGTPAVVSRTAGANYQIKLLASEDV